MFKGKLKALTKQLYPSGRAFRISEGSNIEKFHDGLIDSENDMYEDALSILDQILPDNDNFTADDAELWEIRLGIITNNTLSLDDRKAAIIRKMNHPGTIPARQSHDYLEQQLQAAGFDVYVHENIPAQSIQDILNYNTDFAQLGDGQLGDFQLGDSYSYYNDLFDCFQLGIATLGDTQLAQCSYNQKVANYIDYQKDIFFNIGNNYRSTFLIGGGYPGEFADVDVTRRDELRQLVLRIKPVQSVGYMLINYI